MDTADSSIERAKGSSKALPESSWPEKARRLAGGVLLFAVFWCLVIFVWYQFKELNNFGMPKLTRLQGEEILVEKAGAHVGEKVVIRGKVFEVRASQRGNVFLNFGGAFPTQTFTAVWFRTNSPPLPRLRALESKTVSITGTIVRFEDNPEILLKSLDQISEK